MKSKDKRPIVWLGGTGLPRGAPGRELTSLGHPLLWEPISRETIPKLNQLEPALVIVDADKMTTRLRKILQSLDEQRQYTNSFDLSEMPLAERVLAMARGYVEECEAETTG